MINLGDVKTFIGIVGACVLAVLYFAPQDDVDANTIEIAMISATQEILVWENRKGELENDCLDRPNKVWKCGDTLSILCCWCW